MPKQYLLLVYNDMTTTPGSGVRLFLIPTAKLSTKEENWLLNAHGKVINRDSRFPGLDYVFTALSEGKEDLAEVMQHCDLGPHEKAEDYFGCLLKYEHSITTPLFLDANTHIEAVSSVGYA